MSPPDRDQLLAGLADQLQRLGLGGAGLLLARTLASSGVLVSQLLLFAQPLAPLARWRTTLGSYATVLEDETSWQALIERLEASHS